MSVQTESTDPVESTDRPRPQSRAGCHHFLIRAQPEASALLRVLELFALRGLVPETVACQRAGDGEDELHIHIAMPGLAPQKAAHLAARMRNIVPVTRVVLEPAER